MSLARRWAHVGFAVVLLGWVVSVPTVAGVPASPEVIAWDRTPIRLALAIDQERLIQFPAAIQPGVPPGVARKIRVQAIDDTLYLTANQPFDSQRFQIRELHSGRVFLLDIQAHASGHAHPIRIVSHVNTNETPSNPAPSKTGEASEAGYMGLTRYAAQQVYAPPRLRHDPIGMVRVPIGTSPTDLRLVRGAEVVAAPLASWRTTNRDHGLYVTAVKLTNASTESMVLDPRRLRGQWRTATFHHHDLAPAGEAADTTAVYLISDRPFHEAVASWRR